MDSTALELDAVKFAKTAVTHDQSGKYHEAVFYYKEAAQALIYAGMAGSKLEGIPDKVNEYLDRVQALHNAGELPVTRQLTASSSVTTVTQTAGPQALVPTGSFFLSLNTFYI
ncbi:Calpain-7 [Liparis tanakae]|uniref:Calpain-7 n=1 Tax=Liparis tanakae TaxID=230148 RepID=A0A4Z2E7Y1_9TELE|nr:Calpain-7 [Liparis tanakae]